MIEVDINRVFKIVELREPDEPFKVEVAEYEIDQLIADLQEAAVRLKVDKLTENQATLKSPTDQLRDEIAQLKERVNALEYSNMRKL